MQFLCRPCSRDETSNKQWWPITTLLLLVVLLCFWSAPALLAAPVLADTVTVSVDPADIAVKAGDRFEVNVAISGVQDLGAFELSLRYDPALVQIDKATFGKFIGSTDRDVIPLGPTVDPAAGQVVVGALTMGAQPGAQGQGVLVSLSCTALRAGQGQLALADVRLSDTTGKAIAATGVDGKVTFTGDVVVPTATRAPATPTATLAPASATAPPTLEATATAAPNGTTAPTSSPPAAATAAPNGATAPEPSPTVAATPIPRETLIVAATATAQVRRTAEALLTATSVAAGTPEPTTNAMQATATPEGASAPTSGETPSMSPAVTPPAPSTAIPAAPAGGSGAGLAIGLGVAAVGLGAGGAYLWRRGRQKGS